VLEKAKRTTSIEYLGHRPSDEVYSLMGAANALIFPSQWYEGLPRTIIESFAKGTPVIASRLGSMPELIDDGNTGLLFEPGDDKDLADKVEVFLSDPGMRARMRTAARERYVSAFTAEENYPLLLKFYERVARR
jgi:glycosyltransferase involved in cell wall biosynthesis